MRHERRLRTLTRRFGLLCPRHEAWLRCPACEPEEPMPQVLEAALSAVVSSIVARVDRETLRALCRRVVRPPQYAPCGRCGRPRQCVACGAHYGRALFDQIALTPDEADMMRAALATCRALEHP